MNVMPDFPPIRESVKELARPYIDEGLLTEQERDKGKKILKSTVIGATVVGATVLIITRDQNIIEFSAGLGASLGLMRGIQKTNSPEPLFNEEGDTTTIGDIGGFCILMGYSMYEDIRTFLYTHPLPVKTANLVSTAIGQGIWAPHKNMVLDDTDMFEALLYTQ